MKIMKNKKQLKLFTKIIEYNLDKKTICIDNNIYSIILDGYIDINSKYSLAIDNNQNYLFIKFNGKKYCPGSTIESNKPLIYKNKLSIPKRYKHYFSMLLNTYEIKLINLL